LQSPGPRWGSLQRFPDPLAYFRGEKGEREVKGKGQGGGRGREGKDFGGGNREGRGKERGRKGGEEGRGKGRGCPPSKPLR